ncbi:MAG TPA: AAA domain-containing protein [Abditibacteriaceae bacterium]|jgi:hypothetical protein
MPLLPQNSSLPENLAFSPTDITGFLRFENCERYLRLALFQRNVNRDFLRDYGVGPADLTPLVKQSGFDFENEVEAQMQPSASHQRRHKFPDAAPGKKRETHNAAVVEAARALENGETATLFQPHLRVNLGDWQARGTLDVLQLSRDANGVLSALVVDMKASKDAKTEHRLQVAFYHDMVRAVFEDAGESAPAVRLGILFKGVERDELAPEGRLEFDLQCETAQRELGANTWPLELLDEAMTQSVRDDMAALILEDNSRARRIADADFETVPFNLDFKCDGCRFNEFCLKQAAESDDLSVLPFITASDKSALRKHGVRRVKQLAELKEPKTEKPSPDDPAAMNTVPEHRELVKKLGAAYPVGPRLDELIHRARRYRHWKGDALSRNYNIPSKGYGSLPYCDAAHNPNLVTIYLDAQFDYRYSRLYLLGARVVAHENGAVKTTRNVVHLAPAPPSTPEIERTLLHDWAWDLVHAVVEMAALDENGEACAPIHLVFFSAWDQKHLLEALGRHATDVLSTPLYDFVTQQAAYDSPVHTFLEEEIRELKNYPLLCQNLHSLADFSKVFGQKFDWNQGADFKTIFREGIFDFWKDLKDEEAEKPDWYLGRSRFASQIPLEYAAAAWGELPLDKPDFKHYLGATRENLTAFQARRLEACEYIAGDFKGNDKTFKSKFSLPDLATFEDIAPSFARALDEFMTIERHAELGGWKAAHLAPPERRVLAGTSLVVRYLEEDQTEGIAERNAENARRKLLHEAWKAANPDASRRPKDVMEATRWSMDDMTFRLRIETDHIDCGLDEMLALSTLRDGAWIVLSQRWSTYQKDGASDKPPYQTTPKQMMSAMKGEIARIEVERDAENRAVRAWAEVVFRSFPSGKDSIAGKRSYTFFDRTEPLDSGGCYVLDENPSDVHGGHVVEVVAGLVDAKESTLLERLVTAADACADWPRSARDGQAKFLCGLEELAKIDPGFDFESGKKKFIGDGGDAPFTLVQGPPGTGKSYATAFAILARIQGALAADKEFRLVCGCKTHAATDVLLQNIKAVQEKLKEVRSNSTELFETHFDARILEIPRFRLSPREECTFAEALPRKRDLEKGELPAQKRIDAENWCIIGATPGGVYGAQRDAGDLWGRKWCDCLVLDEASQMNLPEAMMMGLPLCADGQVVVVGDHRQMPPIVKNDWETEMRRTFTQFRAFSSLFDTLRERTKTHGDVAVIKFEQSFRLHRDMAEFLRRAVYYRDEIHYHSKREKCLQLAQTPEEEFVAAALSPEYPLVVVMHDEAASLLQNETECEILLPILRHLAAQTEMRGEIGVVVPHRKQRALLQEKLGDLALRGEDGKACIEVDTVERFQGGEREVIIFTATESDPNYLAQSSFLLDPRRLNVALSRAKKKVIVVASREVFELLPSDEEDFQNAQFWKHLLRRCCTKELYQDEIAGANVQVRGNVCEL